MCQVAHNTDKKHNGRIVKWAILDSNQGPQSYQDFSYAHCVILLSFWVTLEFNLSTIDTTLLLRNCQQLKMSVSYFLSVLYKYHKIKHDFVWRIMFIYAFDIYEY